LLERFGFIKIVFSKWKYMILLNLTSKINYIKIF
jgi:hypothetical protein